MNHKTIILPRIEHIAARNNDKIIDVLTTRGAEAAIDCSPWHNDFPSNARAMLHAAHDGERLFFLFDCETDEIKAENTEPQSAVSNDSCVEVFLQPYEGGEYWNLEVNCLGAVNASHRIEKPRATKLAPDELAQVWRMNQAFVNCSECTLWQQFICVPFSLLGIVYEPGMQIRGNFYACAAKAMHPYFLCWNDIKHPTPNYHLPEFFGNIQLQ